MTRLFLASCINDIECMLKVKPPYVLESFYYLRKAPKDKGATFMNYIKSNKCKMFLLDSGAFTYMSKVKNKGTKVNNVDFDKYVEDYAAFINEYDIKYFFELDVDVVIGLKEVERLREKLERLTNKKCIPVFHKSRGLDYFYKMCKEYDYIALGGLAIKDFSIAEKRNLNAFIKIAHEHNTRIHGLGYTNNDLVTRNHFDTVDSTSWLSAARFGGFYKFDNVNNRLISVKTPKNRRMVKGMYKEVDIYSMREWLKFSRYLLKANKRKIIGFD